MVIETTPKISQFLYTPFFDSDIGSQAIDSEDGGERILLSLQPPHYHFVSALRRIPDNKGRPTQWYAFAPVPVDDRQYEKLLFYEGTPGQKLFADHIGELPDNLEVFENPEVYLAGIRCSDEERGIMRNDLRHYGSELRRRLGLGDRVRLALPRIHTWDDLGALFPEYLDLAELFSEQELKIVFTRPSWGYEGAIRTAFGGSNLVFGLDGTIYRRGELERRLQTIKDSAQKGRVKKQADLFRDYFGAEAIDREDDDPGHIKIADDIMQKLQAMYPAHFSADLNLPTKVVCPDPLTNEDKDMLHDIERYLASLPNRIRYGMRRNLLPSDMLSRAGRILNNAAKREAIRHPTPFYGDSELDRTISNIGNQIGVELLGMLDTETPWRDGKVSSRAHYTVEPETLFARIISFFRRDR